MTIIQFSNQDFQSYSENVARIKLSNMYIVENPLSLSGYSYIPRPCVTAVNDLQSGNIRGIWYQAQNGVVATYVVAGENLFKSVSGGVFTRVGAVQGTGFCTFASSIYHIAICSDDKLYLYDGTSLTLVPIPDGNIPTDVTSLDNYFIIGIANKNLFYWILPGGTTINALSFASAERNPDDIVSVKALGDELWIIGQATAEVFTDTGDVNAPFTRISGRAYQTGCQSKTSVVNTLKDSLPCLIWVTPTKEVVLCQGRPSKISNESVEELLKTSSQFIAWSFRTNKHDFYVLSTDIITLVYDLTADKWYRWSTYQKDTWDAVSGVQINDVIYSVNPNTGSVSTLQDGKIDNTLDYLVCEVSAFIPNTERKSTPCTLISLFLNYGFSDSYSVNPVVELRWSDDGGNSWSTYMQGSIGSKGSYSTNVDFRSLGRINKPGRFIEVRFSEVQSFRFDGATLND